MIIKKNLTNQELIEAKKLYKDSFNDSNEFIDLYFGPYAKNNDFWYGFNDVNELIFMSCLNKKRISIKDTKDYIGLIVAVAVKKEYQGKGIMSSFFYKWLTDISLLYKYIFIQAYNWDIYKKYDFLPCTIKKTFFLRKDQFLKKDPIFDQVNYDVINDIYNVYIKKQKIDSFTYRTSKENKLILKMFEAAGDKIIHTKKSYLIISNNIVISYAFIDFVDFIKLLSHLDFGTEILSFLELDKRYFTEIKEKTKIETKILKKNTQLEEINIFFNEWF